MAKTVEIDIVVNGKMQKATVSAKKLKKALDDTDKSTQKTTKSTGTLDRNLKGAAQATSNSTKEFSKMSQGMGGLVAVYAQIAAATFALSAAFQFLKDAMEVRNLMEGQKAFGAVTGVAYQTLTGDIRAATDGMLSFRDAAQAAAIGTAAGLSRGQLEDLGAAAKNVSFALGRDLTDSFNRLVRGVTKAEPELLDELGIVLRLEPALKNYAAALQKDVKELSQFEKSQAIVNDVLEQAETKFAAIEKIMDPQAAALAQFQQSFNDLMDSFKSGLADTLIPVFNFLKDNTLSLMGALSLVALPIIKQILPNFQDMGEAAEKAYTKATEAANQAASDASQFATASKLASGSPEARAEVMSTSAARGKSLGIEMKGQGAQEGMLSKRQMAIYRKHLKDKEFLRKKFNKKERAEFRRFMAEQEAMLAQSQSKRVRIVKRGQMSIEAAYAKTVAVYRAAQAKMVKATELAAKGMNAAMKLAGFIGVALLIVDIGRMLWNWINPLTEAEKKAKKFREELDAMIERQNTLNEELDRNIQVLSSPDFDLTMYEKMTQEMQAMQSVDFNKVVQEYKLFGKEDENLRKSQAETIKKLGVISGNKGFLALSEVMKNGGEITKEAAKELLEYKNIAVEAGVAINQAAQSQKTINAALASAAPSGLAFAGVASAFQTELTRIQAEIAGLEQKRALQEQEIADVSGIDPGLLSQQRAAQAEVDKARAAALPTDAVRLEKRGLGLGGRTAVREGEFDDEGYLLRLDVLRHQGISSMNDEVEAYNEKLRVLKEIQDQTGITEVGEEGLAAALKEVTDELGVQNKEFDRYKKALDRIHRIQVEQFNLQVKTVNQDKELLAIKTKSGLDEFEKQKQVLDVQQAKRKIARDEAEVAIKLAEERIRALDKEGKLDYVALNNKRERIQAAEDEGRVTREILTEAERAGLAAYDLAVATLGLKQDEVDIGEKLTAVQKALLDLKREELQIETAFKAIELEKRALLIGTTSLQARLIEYTFKSVKIEQDRIKILHDIKELAADTNVDNSEKIKALYIQLELLGLQEEALERQRDLTLDTLDKMNEAMQTSFQSGLASLIKGEENDLTKIAATIGMDIATAAADNLAKKMTENIFRKKDDTPEGRIEEAMIRAAEYHGKVLEAVAQGKPIPGYSGTAGGGSVPETAVNSFRSNFDALLGPRALSGAATNRNDTPGQEEVGVVALDKGSWGRFTGALEDLFSKQEGETGFVGRLGDVFRTGGSVLRDIFSGLVSSLSAIFSRLFGGGASGEYGSMLVSAAIAAATAGAGAGTEGGGSVKDVKGAPTAGPNNMGRYGGVFSKGQKMPGYAFGGIAKGPQSGYPVMMHGKEAIVPLPQGNSIPVELRGAGQQNNVTVNVSVDNQGKVSQDTQATSNDGANLGRAMSVAVQKELQRQKRSGGMLNPYGVA